MKGILQRRHVRPGKGPKTEPGVSFVAKATEEAQTLDAQPRRTLRRKGSGMWESHQGNKGDLTGSRVHTPWKAWHKSVAAQSRPVPREKSEGTHYW